MGHRGALNRIYLDNCATTPVAPEVIEAMTAALGTWGNPSSIHHEGRQAAHLLSRSRQAIAESMGARPAEIILCSSGTEANNLAVGGLISRSISRTGRAKIITSTTEHASVRTRLAWEKRLRGDALHIIEIGVDASGGLRLDELEQHLDDEVTLVALLLVNNETGVCQDLDALKRLKLSRPLVPWLLDAVQAQGKLLMDVRLLPFEMLSFAAHKIYGPKGVGALFLRGGTEPDPMIFGGSQEKFRRAGTEDVAGIAGYATAISLMPPPAETAAHLAALEAEFLTALRAAGADFIINGPARNQAEAAHSPAPGASRLPGFLNLSFDGVADRGDLQIALDLAGISLSSTSACHSGVTEESHVLAAMGIDGQRRAGAIRVLFSRYHSPEDAAECGRIIAKTAQRLRTAGSVA